MSEKTHKSALVVLPPDELCAPLQALRERHDRQAKRWMPHINLLYPFVPATRFAAAVERIAAQLAAVQPFEISLDEVCLFHHRGGAHTLWLAPQPAGPLVSLHDRLLRAFPHCDDNARVHGGYRPHLSIGQVQGRGRAEKLREQIAADWQPLRFAVGALVLIARGDPPQDRFRSVRRLPLGEPAAAAAQGRPAQRKPAQRKPAQGKSLMGKSAMGKSAPDKPTPGAPAGGRGKPRAGARPGSADPRPSSRPSAGPAPRGDGSRKRR